MTDWLELPAKLKDSFEYLKKLHAIVWIMVKSDFSKTKLESKTFFSTLEFAAVPNTPTDLFVPLVQQLLGEWNLVYNAADQHLSSMVLMSTDTVSETWANCLTALEGVGFQWHGRETHQVSFARC